MSELFSGIREEREKGSADRWAILVVEDDRSMRRVLKAMLEKDGYRVYTATNGREALELLNENSEIGVVISDIKMPEMDGIELLDVILREYPYIPVILITAHGTIDSAVGALKKGAFDYITKPFDLSEMRQVVKKAVSTRQFNDLNYYFQPEEWGKFDIIGRSRKMLQVYEIISKVADTPSTVLITGEHGTGKELVARALHQNSSRRNHPFITINCAAIPPNLMEAELFGFERGAFTGAVSSKAGKFELAHGGTLFLDEIGELPIDMQVKLLRVLQNGTFERVGGIRSIHVDVRVIAATNRNLEKMILEGSFRQDLYYRLKVVPIYLPPLRERRSDIPLLVSFFIKKFNKRLNKEIQGITPDALESLQNYDWPGNIRELENVIERSILFASGNKITIQDLPSEIIESYISELSIIDTAGEEELKRAISLPQLWRKEKERLEKKMIAKALKQTNGNVTRAAKLLGISRKSLQKKMKEFNLREK